MFVRTSPKIILHAMWYKDKLLGNMGSERASSCHSDFTSA